MPKTSTNPDGCTSVTLPTTTVHQARICLFEPTRRPTTQVRHIKTPWGVARIDGKIGQGHADVLEAMCWSCDYSRYDLEGRIELLVDPYQLRKVANGGSQGSGKHLQKIIDDLMRVLVDVEVPERNIKICGHIIDKTARSLKEIPGPGRSIGQRNCSPRHYWKVTLGSVFVEFVSEDLPLRYDPRPLARLQYGISQALARHVLSHKLAPAAGYYLDQLLGTVGAGNAEKLGNRRREIRKDSEGLRALGIVVEGQRVFFNKAGAVSRGVPRLQLSAL